MESGGSGDAGPEDGISKVRALSLLHLHLGSRICLREMERALEAARDPAGIWVCTKRGGRIQQTCTRYAGRLIEALALLSACALPLAVCFVVSGCACDRHRVCRPLYGGRRVL